MIQKMKGTYDLIDDMPYVRAIEEQIAKVSRLYQYREIRTPHFEARELFHRSVGEDSDIVTKETYDFMDRGNRHATLRPEGTAGVVRAYIENKLYAEHTAPQKYFYVGSMFRYERPQKGRFREFRQFGAELFGSARPEADADLIAYAVTFLKSLGLSDVDVELNSLGDDASKRAYQETLKTYLKPHVKSLCGDCRTRYEKNPLRILDCKMDADHPAITDAPKPLESLTEEDRTHFETLKRYLEKMRIPFTVNPGLVRGLDYYTHTVFEIKVSEALLGSQNAICGGGRYNSLVESLGGPVTPAVGFSFGIERLIVAMKAAGIQKRDPHMHVYMLVLGNEARPEALALLQRFRTGGLTCNTDFLNKGIKGQFKQAEHQGARFVMIVGPSEVESGTVNINDQETKETFTVAIDDADAFIKKTLASTTDARKERAHGDTSQ